MRCFVCDQEKSESKMHPEPVAKRYVCKICYGYLGLPPFNSPEDEIRDMILTDAKGRADPSRASGGRFKRHKG